MLTKQLEGLLIPPPVPTPMPRPTPTLLTRARSRPFKMDESETKYYKQ